MNGTAGILAPSGRGGRQWDTVRTELLQQQPPRPDNPLELAVMAPLASDVAVFESAMVGVPAELTEDEIKAVVVREGQHADPVEQPVIWGGR